MPNLYLLLARNTDYINYEGCGDLYDKDDAERDVNAMIAAFHTFEDYFYFDTRWSTAVICAAHRTAADIGRTRRSKGAKPNDKLEGSTDAHIHAQPAFAEAKAQTGDD